MDAIPDPRSQIPRTTNSTASSYVHGLISFFYSDSLFTVDAPFTPHPVHTRSQIPDPTSIPQPFLTSTVSSHSSIVIHFSPWTQSQIPDPRSHAPQIPQPLLTSTVSSHSSIVIHFSPWTHHSHLILFTPDPRSQIPPQFHSLSLRPRSHLILL